MNAHIVTKISQVYIETYRDSLPVVRAPIQAAMTQMLNNFVDTLREIEDKVVDDGDDMLADFKNSTRSGDVDSVMEEVVALLKYLIDKLEETQSNMGKQVVALLVEGVHAILSKLPTIVRHNVQFQEIIWKQLCPVLISLLGAPKSEKSAPVQRSTSADEIGRGSGRSSSAPNNLGSAAKVIYSIAAELVRLVGGIGSLRPVLQSLFHRMLLYPPPQHRVDALKVVKELLSDPERLVDMTAPVPGSPGSKADGADMSFIKLILDAVQECCHCNESNVCFTSVTCVDSLLHSLDSLSHGRGISDAVLEDILKARSEMEKVLAARTLTKESQVKREMALSHRDGDGGSFNADSTPEHLLREQLASLERENAAEFVQQMRSKASYLLSLPSVTDVDEALQGSVPGPADPVDVLEGLLDVLSVLLEGKSSCGISFSLGLLLGTEGAREETQRARDAICLSLSSQSFVWIVTRGGQATGHHDRSISKMAVTCIHDFIVAMLTGHQELPHFHVNEFLCKTFEDMLCLEPFVRIEFTANEEVNEARQRHVAAVLDVFEVYLNTENILVFANATVDCMFEDVDEDDGSDSGQRCWWAWRVVLAAGFLRVCPIQPHFLRRICLGHWFLSCSLP
nr:hypothetical protein BaRGS_029491 [Batillaria attramentaria]